MRRALIGGLGLSVFTLAGALLLPALADAGGSSAMYDSIPSPLPPDPPSLGFDAAHFAEIGDRIVLAPGTGRTLTSATVTLSSWACESGTWISGCTSRAGATFTHPSTCKIYAVAGTDPAYAPGALLASVKQDVLVPYRPSSDPACTDAAAGITYQFASTGGQCAIGKPFNATFDFSSLNVTLPEQVIFGVAFDTNVAGYEPIGASGPYDALNVVIMSDLVPSAGEEGPNELYLAGEMTSGEFVRIAAGGVGIPVRLETTSPVPTDQNQCKNGGWEQFGFPNQGQCVAFVVSKGKPAERRQ